MSKSAVRRVWFAYQLVGDSSIRPVAQDWAHAQSLPGIVTRLAATRTLAAFGLTTIPLANHKLVNENNPVVFGDVMPVPQGAYDIMARRSMSARGYNNKFVAMERGAKMQAEALELAKSASEAFATRWAKYL